MNYLRINNNTKAYFEHISVDCINNVEGIVYLEGSMRNVSAAISKLLNTNKGARIQSITKAVVNIFRNEHVIVNACVIFDLSKMADTSISGNEKDENKLEFTKSMRLFCKKHGITCNSHAEKVVYLEGSMRNISAVISKICEVNKDVHVQHFVKEIASIKKDEETGKEYAYLNACVIFD